MLKRDSAAVAEIEHRDGRVTEQPAEGGVAHLVDEDFHAGERGFGQRELERDQGGYEAAAESGPAEPIDARLAWLIPLHHNNRRRLGFSHEWEGGTRSLHRGGAPARVHDAAARALTGAFALEAAFRAGRHAAPNNPVASSSGFATRRSQSRTRPRRMRTRRFGNQGAAR